MGRSAKLKCPAFSSTTSPLPEIRRFSLFAIHMGVSQSPSPHTMRVGHMIFFAKEVKSCSTTFLKVFRIPLPDARKSVLPYFKAVGIFESHTDKAFCGFVFENPPTSFQAVSSHTSAVRQNQLAHKLGIFGAKDYRHSASEAVRDNGSPFKLQIPHKRREIVGIIFHAPSLVGRRRALTETGKINPYDAAVVFKPV